MKNIFIRYGTCLLSKLSIPRLHDEDVSTIATHRPTKTALQKEPYLQNKKPTTTPHHHHKPTHTTQPKPTQHHHPNPNPNPTQPRGKKKFQLAKAIKINYKIKMSKYQNTYLTYILY